MTNWEKKRPCIIPITVCIRVSMVLIRRRHLQHFKTRLFCSTWSTPLPKHSHWHPLQSRVLTFSGLGTLPPWHRNGYKPTNYYTILPPSSHRPSHVFWGILQCLHRVTRSRSSHDFQHTKATVITVRRKLAYARSYKWMVIVMHHQTSTSKIKQQAIFTNSTTALSVKIHVFLVHLPCYLLKLQPTTCRPNIKTLTMENFRIHYRHQIPAFHTNNPVFLDMWPSTFALLRSEHSHHIATRVPQGVGLDSTPPHGLEWEIRSSIRSSDSALFYHITNARTTWLLVDTLVTSHSHVLSAFSSLRSDHTTVLDRGRNLLARASFQFYF